MESVERKRQVGRGVAKRKQKMASVESGKLCPKVCPGIPRGRMSGDLEKFLKYCGMTRREFADMVVSKMFMEREWIESGGEILGNPVAEARYFLTADLLKVCAAEMNLSGDSPVLHKITGERWNAEIKGSAAYIEISRLWKGFTKTRKASPKADGSRAASRNEHSGATNEAKAAPELSQAKKTAVSVADAHRIIGSEDSEIYKLTKHGVLPSFLSGGKLTVYLEDLIGAYERELERAGQSKDRGGYTRRHYMEVVSGKIERLKLFMSGESVSKPSGEGEPKPSCSLANLPVVLLSMYDISAICGLHCSSRWLWLDKLANSGGIAMVQTPGASRKTFRLDDVILAAREHSPKTPYFEWKLGRLEEYAKTLALDRPAKRRL